MNTNNPNPLDQLADIRLPGEVAAWPPAFGYYIVAALIVALITFIVIWLHQRKKRLHMQKQSIDTLRRIDLQDQKALTKIHHVIKSASHHYLPNHGVLHMQKSQWIDLVHTLYFGENATKADQSDKTCDILAQLATWQYDQRSEIASPAEVNVAAQRWLEKALPPKASFLKASQQTAMHDSKPSNGVANV